MSLSNILRGSLNICRLRPLSLIAKTPAVSAFALHTNCFRPQTLQEKCSLLDTRKIQPIKISDAVKQFSTSPARLAGHDHAKLWVLERYVSVALLAICPLAIMMPNMLFDLIMAVSVVMHMHWGIEAIVIDYVRPIIFGNIIPKLAVWSVYLLSIFTLVGLLNLIFNNCGLGNSVRLLWRV